MKVKILLILLIGINISINSQTKEYHTFPISNTVWRESSGGFQCDCCSEYQYFINGDTLINKLIYHKIQKTGINLYYENYGIGFCSKNIRSTINNYVGSIREVEKKLYFIVAGEKKDTLLYDFGLKINDTIPRSYLNFSDDTIYISNVDSILINGSYRKMFEISTKQNIGYVKIIEGIGSTSGLFGSLIPPFENSTTLLCVKSNNNTIYPNNSTECNLATKIDITDSKDSFSITPNPIELNSIITYSNNDIIDILIIDILGKVRKQINNLSNGSVINSEDLSSGLYFYKVLKKGNELYQGKIMIK